MKRVRERSHYREKADRLAFYARLIAAGYPSDQANDISLKISRDIYTWRNGKIWDASGRSVIAELSLASIDTSSQGDRSIA